jgi:hypothetical protein
MRRNPRVVQGQDFVQRAEDGSIPPICMGADGIAIAADGIAIAADGYLHVTADQLYRQAKCRGGEDQRRRPYVLFRTPIGAGPIRLR